MSIQRTWQIIRAFCSTLALLLSSISSGEMYISAKRPRRASSSTPCTVSAMVLYSETSLVVTRRPPIVTKKPYRISKSCGACFQASSDFFLSWFKPETNFRAWDHCCSAQKRTISGAISATKTHLAFRRRIRNLLVLAGGMFRWMAV